VLVVFLIGMGWGCWVSFYFIFKTNLYSGIQA
jgi:hypothetical protein